MRQAVIFDFDGVLADTERLHLLAFQDVFGPRGWTLDEDAYFERYLGYDDRRLITEFAHEQGVVMERQSIDRIVEDKGQRYLERLGSADILFPAAAACVRRIGARFPLGIASGSLHAEIERILAVGGLSDAFRVIVGADDVSERKPAAAPYLAATARLGVSPEMSVAVEDSRWGLESARAAGLSTIAVATSYPAAALRPADAVITSLDELTIELVSLLLMRDVPRH